MLFSKFSSDYVKHLALRRGCSPATCDGYGRVLTQFVGHLLAEKLTDDVRHFTPDTVESFVTKLADAGRKGSAINHKLAVLASLAKWGMTQKDTRGKYFLAENPVSRVERPKRVKPPEKFLTLQELRALLTVEAKPYERLALDMFIDTALRVSELATAKVKHLRLDGDLLTLSVIVKGGRPRNVALGRELAERLEAPLRERKAGPEEPLLLNSLTPQVSR